MLHFGDCNHAADSLALTAVPVITLLLLTNLAMGSCDIVGL